MKLKESLFSYSLFTEICSRIKKRKNTSFTTFNILFPVLFMAGALSFLDIVF